MPVSAFALALSAAFLHALWNLLLAREKDPEPATAVAIFASVVVFAPVAAIVWDVDPRVWPFIAVTSLLQLVYFALLATAYRRAELSFVYPIARGLAPVLVLLVGVVALGTGATAAQAAGVCLVGLGILLVRGLGGDRDLVGGRSPLRSRLRSLRTTSWTSPASATRIRSSTSSSPWLRRPCVGCCWWLRFPADERGYALAPALLPLLRASSRSLRTCSCSRHSSGHPPRRSLQYARRVF
jgi:uncharacterized membrane protein